MTESGIQKQMKDLIKVSARMLRLTTVDEICRLTAESVVNYSIFQRSVVSILEPDGTFSRLGFGGLSEEEVRSLQTMTKSTMDDMKDQLEDQFRIGRSYYLPHDQHSMQGLSSNQESSGEGWHPDDFLFIPVYDPSDNIVGLISLDDPSDGKRPTEESLLPLELFATLMAPALEYLRNLGKQQEMIQRLRDQQQVVLELSTPVISVWDRVLVLPLIGSVDSARALQIMENVLIEISKNQACVVIIDITGVPVIDTLVASHLIKTVSAAKLLGAQTIITGINPEVAQTLVHLGVDLADITTKSNLAKGIETALLMTGKAIVSTSSDE